MEQQTTKKMWKPDWVAMSVTKYWQHPKKKGVWWGMYQWVNDGERVFTLSNGKKHLSFESWQMAKKLGWKSYE